MMRRLIQFLGMLLTLALTAIPCAADISVTSELWIGDPVGDTVPIYGYGTADDHDCQGNMTIEVQIKDPNNLTIAVHSTDGWCNASALTESSIVFDGSPEGDYKAITSATSATGHGGCALGLAGVTFFNAAFKKNHFNALIGKWVYLRDDSYCTGNCQPAEWCSTQECEWLSIYGFRISALITGFCIALPPYPTCSPARPPCRQSFGFVWFTADNECS